jgi:tRNA (adenine57-N1/adenine58-N1)-methyltransferase
MDVIHEGDDVLLYLDERRTYLVRVGEGVSFHTHKGYLQLGELIGRGFGTPIKSSLGTEFYAFKPLVRDYILKTRRHTQIMYPKDMGLLILLTGIGPGSRVVEAGTGSGALTSVLANFIRPNGRVYSYEIREEFLKGAGANLRRVGLLDYVELKLRDITGGIDEDGVDAVVLDLAVPWLVVPHACRSLRGSGVLASFSPTIEQVMRTVEALREHPFVEVETVELLMRRMNIGENRTRPETLMIGHTGYITVARKVLAE